ncbi:MAG TPA: hypothetical protein VLH15_00730 [Dehalococcoidales bacterium]|nr:hypothetical protein [Dehalococcoidales bacterium]
MSIEPCIQEKINDIAEDHTHGASELARQSLETIKLAASRVENDDPEFFLDQVNEVGSRLIAVHPAMAPIFYMIKRLQASLDDYKVTSVTELKKILNNTVDELVQTSISAAAQIASYAAELVSHRETIMTHSYSSTVASAVKRAHELYGVQVIVTRSGVSRAGQRAAWEFGYTGLQITYIDDTAMGLFVPQCGKIMIGADRVCSDGGVVNGVGTYLLALAAHDNGVPLYVLCENAKFDPRMGSAEFDTEDKNPGELAAPGILPEGVNIKNPYFDLTPLRLVTGFITETGPVNQKDVLSYIEDLASELR